MSSKPPWPRAATLGTPSTGSDSFAARQDADAAGPFRHDDVAVRQEIQPPGIFAGRLTIVSASTATALVWKRRLGKGGKGTAASATAMRPGRDQSRFLAHVSDVGRSRSRTTAQPIAGKCGSTCFTSR